MSIITNSKDREELQRLMASFKGKVQKIKIANRKLPRALQYTPGTVGGKEKGMIVRSNPLRG